MPSISLLRLAGFALAVCPSLAMSQQLSDAGLGTVKRMYNASVQTNPFDALITGIAYVNDKVYVCSGSPGGTTTPLVYEFTNGKKTAQFTTPGAPISGSFDMDTDGKLIFNAADNGILVYDTKGNTTNLLITTKNGVHRLTKNPIPVAVTSPHAVAYDPNGNSGKGSLFVGAQSGGPILEVDLDGNTLNTFPNLGWRAGGLTCDPVTGNLWCATGAGIYDIVELDRNNKLKPTGNKFMQGYPAHQWDLRCCGGICGIPGGDKYSYASFFDIALMNRLPGDDYVYIHRVHLNKNILGYDEAEIVGGINTTSNLSRGQLGSLGAIKAGDTLSWRFLPGKSAKKNQPVITTLSVGPDASVDGVNFGGLFLPEWRIQSPFSVPASNAMLFLPATTVGGPVISVKLPANILSCMELIRLQGIVIEIPSIDFIATNEIWAHHFDEKSCSIIVEAIGTNSFNAVTTSGFFRVIHKGGPPIKDVTFDLMACRDPLQTTMYFDTDNPNMADVFNAGNSTTASCTGTYRNNSDTNTGLVYDSQNAPVVVACAPATANSGFMGLHAYNNGNGSNYKALKFRFSGAKFLGTPANPKVFEFDCDTDGGRGTNGASMEGMVITITYITGKVVSSELRPDLNSPVSRSFCGF